jgi:hypothetical protein
MGAVALLYVVLGTLGLRTAWAHRRYSNLSFAQLLGGVLSLSLGVLRLFGLSADQFAPVLLGFLALFVYFGLRARLRGELAEARAVQWTGFWDWFELE